MVGREQPEIHREPLFVKLDSATRFFKRTQFFAILNTEVASGRIRPDIANRMAEEFDYQQPLPVLGPWCLRPFWRDIRQALRHQQR